MKKHFLFIIIPLMIAAIILPFCAGSKSDKPDESVDINGLIEDVQRASVMVTVGEYHGSGVILSKDADTVMIVSAAHLCEGFDQAIITFTGNKVGFADVVLLDSEKDLCFLRINVSDMDKALADSVKAAYIDISAYEKLERDTEVYLVGSGTLASGNVFVGTVANTYFYVPDFDMNMLYLYADTLEGMSGCGCFDASGDLLGILVGGAESSEAVCVPIEIVNSEFNLYKNGG